jgi:hypothetical protein
MSKAAESQRQRLCVTRLRMKCVEVYNQLCQTEDVDQIAYPELPTPKRPGARVLSIRKGRLGPSSLPSRKLAGRQ